MPEHVDTMEKLEKLKINISPIPRVLFYSTYSFIENYLDLKKKASKSPLIDVELNKVGVSTVGETSNFSRHLLFEKERQLRDLALQ